MAARKPSQIFAALGDETRLALVSRLCREGPLSIAKLTEGSRITRQAVSKHLRVMETARVARCTRRGREVFWELDERRLDEARDYLAAIAHEWDCALSRLKKFVEE